MYLLYSVKLIAQYGIYYLLITSRDPLSIRHFIKFPHLLSLDLYIHQFLNVRSLLFGDSEIINLNNKGRDLTIFLLSAGARLVAQRFLGLFILLLKLL